jgi:hypothetical protein
MASSPSYHCGYHLDTTCHHHGYLRDTTCRHRRPIIDLFTLSWILLMCRLPLALHMRFHLHVFGIVKSNAINWLFGLHELGQWASSCPSLAAAHYPFFWFCCYLNLFCLSLLASIACRLKSSSIKVI